MAERHGFGERLKALRAAAGLSQPALADRAGVSVSAVRQFEYGLREPAFGTLVKLAEALGVSLDAFKDGAAPPTKAAGGPPIAEASAPDAPAVKPKRGRGKPGAKGRGKGGA